MHIYIVCNPFYARDSEQPPTPLPRLPALLGEGGWFVDDGKATWMTAPRAPLPHMWPRGGGSGPVAAPPSEQRFPATGS